MLKAIQQRQLIDEHTTQSKAAGTDQAPARNLSMPIEDALEVFVEVFDSQRSQLVEDTPHLPTHIILWPPASVSGHQPPLLEHAYRSQQRSVVMSVSQQVAYVSRQFALTHDYQLAGFSTIISISRGKFGSQRYPNVGHYRDKVQLPPIDPPMPP